jgi:steroid delta-isomerase-like uncharacterized protein
LTSVPATDAASKPARTTAASLEKIARAYFGAIAAGDVDGALALWHEEGIDDVVPLQVFRGHEEIRFFLSSTIGAMPDQELTVQRVVAARGVAAVQWRLRGTFSGAPFQGIEPTGRRVELRGVDLLEIENGKIVRNTAYYDGAEFARAVGMLPSRDSTAEQAMTTAFNALTRARSMLRERMG